MKTIHDAYQREENITLALAQLLSKSINSVNRLLVIEQVVSVS